ncbi:MAG: cation-translocating P-type ATPase [Coriobacteriia bacterium]|nr:cation-translocating P-type ATPase [Coriobacteriia bacterium]
MSPAATDTTSPAWHTLPASEAAGTLGTDPVAGLTNAEAQQRLSTVGPNRLSGKARTPAWRLFLSQYQDFMIYVLVVAVVIAAFEGQVAESIAILAILLLNGVLGFVQEYRAQHALEALQELSAPAATVIRDGVERQLPAEELVPGDIVLLEAGDKVPADGRLLEAVALRIGESALTGESQPSSKDAEYLSAPDAALGDRLGTVFAGTAVTVGRGRLVVTSTGNSTEMGAIANLLAQTEDESTPLQKTLNTVGKRIALIVLAIAAVVFVEEAIVAWRSLSESGLASAFGDPAFRSALTAGLLVTISLAVAAIPEGLPAIVTVALSLGVRRMAEHHAIVRKLHAVETLGSTSFICSDKTGTLTRNEMSVRRIVVGTDVAAVAADASLEPLVEDLDLDLDDLALLLEIAAANNDAHITAAGELVGDPTETALLVAAQQLAPDHLQPPRIAEVPFDSERKRMTTVHEVDGSRVALMKGGADVVLALCTHALMRGRIVPITEDLHAEIRALNAELAASGFRTLAFAMRALPDSAEPIEVTAEALERDLTYVGILGLTDPPRAEVPAAIAECHSAGIQVAMVTGDHALTARAIASEIGLLDTDRVVSGPELEAMSDDDLYAAVESIRVYARVNPAHKLRIVDALKRHGHIVAMTGDGVNDAPALKRADIGVAMGLVGTDVAREAADMVLADDNFATIVHAIEQGRAVFDNLRKVILFLLSCNVSEVLVVFLTALFSPAAALLPLQILWINLVTDGLPALALGVDPKDPDVMGRAPRDPGESILSRKNQLTIAWQGLVMAASALTLYYGVAPFMSGASPDANRTVLFTALVLMQLLHAFGFRSERTTVWHPRSLENRWLSLSLLGSMALQALVIYPPPFQRLFHTAPLSLAQWAGVAGAAILAVAVIDVAKLATARRAPNRRRRTAR